ncbi:MAG: alpha/beta fold hydrolase, partial [Spirochaetaceae bacterium]|nr:alpha/beta fold hydrolase [Spirochaetaceae bacterium]
MSPMTLPGLEAARIRYEEEYRRHFTEGESKAPGIGMPRCLESPGSKLGLVLVHGYMAAPEEVALLAERIRALGVTVYLPRLPGHGTAPGNLESVGRGDWVRAVAEAVDDLGPRVERLAIGGFSTGAGLALLEAERRPERYAAVLSLSAPLVLADPRARLLGALDRGKALARRLGLARLGANFMPNHPDNPDINYARNCVHGMAEVKRLMDEVGRGLGSLRAPLLVAQGSGDPTIRADAPAMIHARAGSPRKRLLIVPSERHGIVRGPALEATFAAVEAFLR